MTEVPILGLTGVSKVFESRPDLAERIAGMLGASKPEIRVCALDAIDLSVRQGEVVGLVGESGCGKSTLGRIISQIMPLSTGTIRWKGVDTATMDRPQRRAANLAIQMIAQDPAASLNPRMRVRDIVGEAPLAHGMIQRSERDGQVGELLGRVGLDPSMIERYPHQLSGGQRQRVSIARALAVRPELIVCDESVASLDVSIAAQVLNLFSDLKDTFDLTYLFISHDLGVVEHISDRVAIMYLGRIVETAATQQLFARPQHPYTQALLAEVPRLDRRKRRFASIRGEIPSPMNPPDGCHFHPRCPHAMDVCRRIVPTLHEVAAGHASACHLPG